MTDTIDTIFATCRRVVNGRDIVDIFDHLSGEVDELDDEIVNVSLGKAPGDDGVVGESVDIILCAVDMIWKTDPTMTSEKLRATIDAKLEKWERLYSVRSA